MTNPDPNAPRSATDAYAPPIAPLPQPERQRSPTEATLGQRIGGALIVVQVVLSVIEFVIMPWDDKAAARLFGQFIGTALSFAIGVALIAKNRAIVPLAIARLVLGMIISIPMYAQEDPFVVVVNVVMCLAVLLFLIGDASKPRMAFGGALFGLYVLTAIIGFNVIVTGKNPIAVLVQGAMGGLEPGAARDVTGDASHYRLHTPNDKWRLRTAAAAKKDNPLADRWLIRPDVDAHVLVIAEKIQGMLVLPDALTDVVVSNAKKGSTEFELIDRYPLKTHPENGRLVHTKSTTNKIEVETLTGVIAVYEAGYQIIAFAPRKTYADVEADLRSIVESFELPTDERPGVPQDVDPNPVTRVEGIAQKYAITAPSVGWFLRKDEAAKKDNPLSDRWMVRPDKDAHLFVLAESAPGAVIDLERYTDAVSVVVTDKLKGTILSREPSKTQPKVGRILHAKAEVNEMKLEYYYGLFADGDRAFQVIAFTREGTFASLKDDFMKAIEGFELPPVAENKAAATKR